MHFLRAELVPLVGKTQAINQQLTELKAVKDRSSSKCILPKEETLFSPSDTIEGDNGGPSSTASGKVS